jgi:hypothetical protein
VAGSSKHSNELSHSVKYGEFLNRLSVYQLLKKTPALWSLVCRRIVNKVFRREAAPVVSHVHHNSCIVCSGAKPGLRGERPATNRRNLTRPI